MTQGFDSMRSLHSGFHARGSSCAIMAPFLADQNEKVHVFSRGDNAMDFFRREFTLITEIV